MCQGAETVNQLHQQKDRLKGAQRKLMDVMNTLGLSNSLMGGTHAQPPVLCVHACVYCPSFVVLPPDGICFCCSRSTCRFLVCIFRAIDG